MARASLLYRGRVANGGQPLATVSSVISP